MIKRLHTAALIAFEVGAIVVETALLAVAVRNILNTLQYPPDEPKKPEQRWVN